MKYETAPDRRRQFGEPVSQPVKAAIKPSTADFSMTRIRRNRSPVLKRKNNKLYLNENWPSLKKLASGSLALDFHLAAL